MKVFNNDWQDILESQFAKTYYKELRKELEKEYWTQNVYPTKYDIFNAYHTTSYQDTKVVILGQDPYHGKGQAHGFSFSVKPRIYLPPSLKNIYKEIEQDMGLKMPFHGCLIEWAERGVLLLNSSLTVRGGTPNSHKDIGWHQFTDATISALNEKTTPVVFILWGNFAQKKQELITNSHHLILKAAHPSPYSADKGFFGCEHFSKANDFLKSTNQEVIAWSLSSIQVVEQKMMKTVNV